MLFLVTNCLLGKTNTLRQFRTITDQECPVELYASDNNMRLCFQTLLLISLYTLTFGEPIVKIEDGTLLGTFSESASGALHSMFLGIPYAKPPVSLALK